MEVSRINRLIFIWDFNCKDKYRNWNYRLNKCFVDHHIQEMIPVIGSMYSKQEKATLMERFESCLFERYKETWISKVNATSSVRSNNGGNKLRTYSQFKREYKAEKYVSDNSLSHPLGSALAKFRTGLVPLRTETGRFESLPLPQRVCFICSNVVENEMHVLLNCPLYDDTRRELFLHAAQINDSFSILNDMDKMCFLLSNVDMVKFSAKTRNDIFKVRRNALYHTVN